eukprot:2632621-Rhodomonas_salina.1
MCMGIAVTWRWRNQMLTSMRPVQSVRGTQLSSRHSTKHAVPALLASVPRYAEARIPGSEMRAVSTGHGVGAG